MTHVACLIEGYADDHVKFQQRFNGRMYGKAKLRVRYAMVYTFSINDEGKDGFLSDLKSLMGRIWDVRGDHFDWKKMIGWATMILRPMGLKPIDFDKIPNSGIRGAEVDGKENYNLHFIPLGYVNDPRDKDGVELV